MDLVVRGEETRITSRQSCQDQRGLKRELHVLNKGKLVALSMQ